NEQSDQRAARAAKRARRVYEQLEPKDLIFKYTWLFKTHWVERSADEIADENLDYQERETRVTVQRIEALRVVMDKHGIEGAGALAETGEAASVVGSLIPHVLLTIDEQIQAVEMLLGYGPLPESQTRQWLIWGFLG